MAPRTSRATGEHGIARTGEWTIAGRESATRGANSKPLPAVPRASLPTLRRAVPRWWWWAALIGAWTLFGIFSANQTYLYVASTGRKVEASWRQLYLLSLTSAWMWTLYTPLVVWLARRVRIERPRWMSRLLVHLAIAIALHTADVWLDHLRFPLLTDYPPRPFLPQFLFQFDINVFTYFVIVAAAHAVDYYHLSRERRLRAERLQAQLTSAQLEVLKMQLQPHFLFNTLNTISELVHEDSDAADRMITRLGDLLRLSLDNAGRQEVALKQELEFLQAYLEIETTRFEDRLSIHLDVEPDTLDARVPNLVLQPLVENAIHHGIASSSAPGRVDIIARRMDGRLELEVRDSGTGLRGAPAPREGVGLRNTRARLQQLYGADHRFELRGGATGGVIVNISFPFRVEAGDVGGDGLQPDDQGKAADVEDQSGGSG
jgi:two-component system LytT family sensor kinase